MKYLVTFNVLNPKTGHICPVRASVEVKDVTRKAAIAASRKYMEEIGIGIVPTPSSVKSIGAAPRSRPLRLKVELPRL